MKVEDIKKEIEKLEDDDYWEVLDVFLEDNDALNVIYDAIYFNEQEKISVANTETLADMLKTAMMQIDEIVNEIVKDKR